MPETYGELGYVAPSSSSIDVSTSGNNTLIAAVTGQIIRVYQIFIVFNGDVNIIFRDGASTGLTGTMNMLSNGTFVLDYSGRPWFTTASGNAFVLNLSGAVQASGRVYFLQS